MTINIKIEKKDLWLMSAIMIFLIGVGYVVAYNTNWKTNPGDPAVMGHTPDEIIVQNGSGDTINLTTYVNQINQACGSGSNQEIILKNVNITYIPCKLTITGRDYSGSSEKCSTKMEYDGKVINWESSHHDEYSDSMCWTEFSNSLRTKIWEEYTYLGKEPGNSGDTFDCAMIKIIPYP
jgi:hypothetical protein